MKSVTPATAIIVVIWEVIDIQGCLKSVKCLKIPHFKVEDIQNIKDILGDV